MQPGGMRPLGLIPDGLSALGRGLGIDVDWQDWRRGGFPKWVPSRLRPMGPRLLKDGSTVGHVTMRNQRDEVVQEGGTG
jgi:hypothetical protein